MTKPATAAELRKILIDVLEKYENSFCTAVAMTKVLKEHGILIDEKLDELAHSNEVRGLVHPRFAPLISAIESEDDEALRQALLSMQTPDRIM